MFRIGQRIVCVDDTNQDPRYASVMAGVIYTIRGFGEPWPKVRDFKGAIVLLDEVKRQFRTRSRAYDCGFGAFRFRPLVEPSIEWARAIDRSVFERPTRRIAA